MPRRTCLAIVLAAGEGTRMQSRTPKVLHQVAGRSLLAHVVNAASAAGTSNLAIVVGPDHGAVSADARKYAPKVQIFEQLERRGTAHAVLSARKAIARGADDILVIFGDTPLVRAETLSKLRGALSEGAAVAVLGFKPANPQGYGRLVMLGRELVAIREERDATPEERKIGLCNGGLMALAGKQALAILTRIGNANAPCSPTRSAIGARGKFSSSTTLSIHAGWPPARTLPTRSMPGKRMVFRAGNASIYTTCSKARRLCQFCSRLRRSAVGNTAMNRFARPCPLHYPMIGKPTLPALIKNSATKFAARCAAPRNRI